MLVHSGRLVTLATRFPGRAGTPWRVRYPSFCFRKGREVERLPRLLTARGPQTGTRSARCRFTDPPESLVAAAGLKSEVRDRYRVIAYRVERPDAGLAGLHPVSAQKIYNVPMLDRRQFL